MDTSEPLHLLHLLGLSASVDGGKLIVRPADLLDDDVRWFIRKHRDDLIAAVRAETVATSHRWLIHFPDREPLQIFTHPDADFERVMRRYPNALAAEPLPDIRRCEGYLPTEVDQPNQP